MSERSERINIAARFAHGCAIESAVVTRSAGPMVHQ